MNAATERTTAERVTAGAEFLDEHDPQWWREDTDRAIDLDRLALNQTDLCVLGQRCPLEVLAAHAGTEVSDLGDDDRGDAYLAYALHLSGLRGREFVEWVTAHGFSASGADRKGWDRLAARWRRVIEERRAAA